MPVSRPTMKRRVGPNRTQQPDHPGLDARRSAERPRTSRLKRVGQREDLGADGVPLGLVAVEQPGRRPPVHGGGELPPEVHRVLDAGVHALPAERRVHVRGVAGQEHPADPVVPGLPALAEEARAPARLAHAEVVAGDAAERVAQLVQRAAARRAGPVRAAGPTRWRGTSRRRTARTAPAPRGRCCAEQVSSGGWASRTSASMMCVSYCVPTKSTPIRPRTVLCAPSAPTT